MDISVIIPIYNVEEYLVECLESVKRSVAGLDAEVLLIDDGSTDTSSVIAELYAEKEKIFFYYRIENGGLGHARNYGASLATGKYLCFVDSDDMLVSGVLAKMFHTAEKNKSELTICNVARIKGKKILDANSYLRTFYDLTDNVSHIRKHPNFVHDPVAWNKLILHSFYKKYSIKYPEGIMFEDSLPSAKMHCCCNKVSVVRETGYLYRVRTGDNTQITRIVNQRSLHDLIEMKKQTLQCLKEYMPDSPAVEEFEIKVLTFDLNRWLNQLWLFPNDEAIGLIKQIKSFVENHIRKESIRKIPLIQQQIFYDILHEDLPHLCKVINYKKANFSRVPIVSAEAQYRMQIPSYILTIPERNIVYDFSNNILPCSFVDSGKIEASEISLSGYIYIPRVSIPFSTVLPMQAYLLNERTGDKYFLEIAPLKATRLTEEKGSVLNYDDYQYYRYDYDGAGFKLDIDFATLVKNENLHGRNFIILSFDFGIRKGNWMLKGVSEETKKTLENFVYESGQYFGRIVFDIQNIISLDIIDRQESEDVFERSPSTIGIPFKSSLAGKQILLLKQKNKKLQMKCEKLQKFYKIRDSIFPTNSIRRKLYNILIKVFSK